MTANTLSVKQAGTFMTVTVDFAIPADAKVVRDGKACRLQDIKRGDSVAVAFSTQPDGMGICVTHVEICKPAVH